MPKYTLSVFDLDISFTTEADSARVEKACAYVEEIYEGLKSQGTQLGRDRLLAIILLGLADDLLQLKQHEATNTERLANLLQSIEKRET